MQHYPSYRSLISGKCFNFDWLWNGMGGAGLGEAIRRPLFPQVISLGSPMGPSQLSCHHPNQSLKHLPDIRTWNSSTAALHLFYFHLVKCTVAEPAPPPVAGCQLPKLKIFKLNFVRSSFQKWFFNINIFILVTYHLDRVFHIKLEIQQ